MPDCNAEGPVYCRFGPAITEQRAPLLAQIIGHMGIGAVQRFDMAGAGIGHAQHAPE
ncbi:hypothetical protein [Halochromatium roseum]|uniref:hypothetical protein n=1 Tax=Halochromatium roseum TaxID=391920 RepID=UPI001913B59F|nr:hypothetical protein [Halochromatium roseum]